MALQYLTKDGDTVDEIAWRQYGARIGAAEAVFQANTGLADAGPVLPAGIVVVLPDLPDPAVEIPVLRVWG